MEKRTPLESSEIRTEPNNISMNLKKEESRNMPPPMYWSHRTHISSQLCKKLEEFIKTDETDWKHLVYIKSPNGYQYQDEVTNYNQTTEKMDISQISLVHYMNNLNSSNINLINLEQVRNATTSSTEPQFSYELQRYQQAKTNPNFAQILEVQGGVEIDLRNKFEDIDYDKLLDEYIYYKGKVQLIACIFRKLGLSFTLISILSLLLCFLIIIYLSFSDYYIGGVILWLGVEIIGDLFLILISLKATGAIKANNVLKICRLYKWIASVIVGYTLALIAISIYSNLSGALPCQGDLSSNSKRDKSEGIGCIIIIGLISCFVVKLFMLMIYLILGYMWRKYCICKCERQEILGMNISGGSVPNRSCSESRVEKELASSISSQGTSHPSRFSLAGSRRCNYGSSNNPHPPSIPNQNNIHT